MWMNALTTTEAATRTPCVRMNRAVSLVHATRTTKATDSTADVSGSHLVEAGT